MRVRGVVSYLKGEVVVVEPHQHRYHERVRQLPPEAASHAHAVGVESAPHTPLQYNMTNHGKQGAQVRILKRSDAVVPVDNGSWRLPCMAFQSTQSRPGAHRQVV